MRLTLSAFFVTTIVTLFGWNSFGADSLTGSVGFLIHDNNLYLVGTDVKETVRQCRELKTYAFMYNNRNGKPNPVSECNIEKTTQAILSTGTYPTYTYSSSGDIEKWRSSLTVAVAVSDIVPREIWEFTVNRPRDGVCYNSALVDSGILSTEERSGTIQSVMYLLGLNTLNISKSPDRSLVLDYGPRSNSPAIEKRFAFEINAKNKNAVKKQLTTILATDFSPGSIMCIYSGPLDKVSNLIKDTGFGQFSLGKTLQNISADDPRYLEYKGGHCLTFMTPNLIADSNRMLPYNLVNTNVAFEWIVKLMEGFETTGTLYYFKITENKAKYKSWLDEKIKSDPRLEGLLDLAKKHRLFYQSIDVEKCEYTSQFDLYDEMCIKNNPKLKSELENFWKTVGIPTLKNKVYDSFWEARRNEDYFAFNGVEKFAYEIFEELTYFPSGLKLVEPAPGDE